MKKPAKTVGELEYMLRMQLERTCTRRTDTAAVHIEPGRGTWRGVVQQQEPHDVYLTEMINLICDQLRNEYDLARR